MKVCKICKKEFQPTKTTQRVCSFQCSIQFAKEKREAKEKRNWNLKKKILKEDLETTQSLIKKLQTVFNKFIRLRDKNKSCVSCGCEWRSNFQAGHFYSSVHYGTRFDERNVHSQCRRCNLYLSGNLIDYSIGILNRITIKDYEEIKVKSKQTVKFDRQELKELIEVYKEKIKKIE